MKSLKEIRDRHENLRIELMYIDWCMEHGMQFELNPKEIELEFKEAERELEATFYGETG